MRNRIATFRQGIHDARLLVSFGRLMHGQPSGEKWRGRKRYCVLLLAEHDKRKLILQRSNGLV